MTDPDRVTHEVWPIIDSDQMAEIRTTVESEPVLIADGHHRYETALAYRAEQDRLGGAPGDDDFVMALVVELADEQLTVQAIHRLIEGLPPGFDLLTALDPWFDITPTEPADRTITVRMAEAGAVAVLTRSGAWLARPRRELTEAARTTLTAAVSTWRWPVCRPIGWSSSTVGTTPPRPWPPARRTRRCCCVRPPWNRSVK